jgi:segregation and condensation protein B
MGRPPKSRAEKTFDRELADLPEPLRRREWMMRVEAVIFAAAKPVTRETLAPLIGSACELDPLIADIRAQLAARPYEIVTVAGGYQYRTRQHLAAAILASGTVATPPVTLSPLEQLALTTIAYFQPITRTQIAEVLGKTVSRDVIAFLRSVKLVAAGPRSPQPGAPLTYVTTGEFLAHAGLDSLRDLSDLDSLEEAGLLGKAPLPHELREALGIADESQEGADDPGVEEDGFWDEIADDNNKGGHP